jgi:hypothetical protein
MCETKGKRGSVMGCGKKRWS